MADVAADDRQPVMHGSRPDQHILQPYWRSAPFEVRQEVASPKGDLLIDRQESKPGKDFARKALPERSARRMTSRTEAQFSHADDGGREIIVPGFP